MLTLEELKAEAKRQGYKLIEDKRPRFERCLCGHNVHQWVSGPEGWAVYCKHCGQEGPWVRGEARCDFAGLDGGRKS